ncbi:MAG: hypothetical protein AAFP68_16765 [Pseudomonadota bacterium]
MQADEIRQVIREEVARNQLREVLEEPEKKKINWGRHPLVITVAGFVCTALIGNTLEARFAERDKLRVEQERILQKAKEREAEALADLRSFVELAYERQVLSDLVRSAIGRGNKDEAIARKKAYDAVFTKWNIEVYPRLKNLRTLTNIRGGPIEHKQSIFEKAIEYTILPRFGAADWCLTTAYDISYRQDFPFPSLKTEIQSGQNCNGAGANWTTYMRQNRNEVRECIGGVLSYMIREIRHQSATVLDPPPTPEEVKKRGTEIAEALRESCPVLSAKDLAAVREKHHLKQLEKKKKREEAERLAAETADKLSAEKAATGDVTASPALTPAATPAKVGE